MSPYPPVPLPGLPARVRIYEVGPRDGLQNEAAVVPAAVKVEFIRRLVRAGLGAVEATSFVSPSWVPQLADAEQVLAGVTELDGRFPVLVPNAAGLDRASRAGAREVAVFAAATQTFARRNLNRSLDESLAMLTEVAGTARQRGMAVRGYVSMCFGDPWEGAVDPAAVVRVARALSDAGCTEISLGDTIGVATPGAVRDLVGRLAAAGIDLASLAVHFHDTYGQALANTLAALQAGVTTVDSSAGGLGGCPYARSATGNLATEDLLYQLHGMGIDTGVDLDALVATSVWMAGELGRPSPSRAVHALASQAGARS